MPGDHWQKFANLRAYLGFMFGHPGKKLLFMGCEFGQEREWNHDQSLDWHLLEKPEHAGIQRLVRDLNMLYQSRPALHQVDFDSKGFEWIDHSDAAHSVLSFIRRGTNPDSFIVVVCNFTPTVQNGYRVGVPQPGVYVERLNTDSVHYGGSNQGTPHGAATADPKAWHGKPHSIALTVPPLATVILEWTL
jgi:1,4-alpha-glucan branching enzyme